MQPPLARGLSRGGAHTTAWWVHNRPSTLRPPPSATLHITARWGRVRASPSAFRHTARWVRTEPRPAHLAVRQRVDQLEPYPWAFGPRRGDALLADVEADDRGPAGRLNTHIPPAQRHHSEGPCSSLPCTHAAPPPPPPTRRPRPSGQELPLSTHLDDPRAVAERRPDLHGHGTRAGARPWLCLRPVALVHRDGRRTPHHGVVAVRGVAHDDARAARRGVGLQNRGHRRQPGLGRREDAAASCGVGARARGTARIIHPWRCGSWWCCSLALDHARMGAQGDRTRRGASRLGAVRSTGSKILNRSWKTWKRPPTRTALAALRHLLAHGMAEWARAIAADDAAQAAALLSRTPAAAPATQQQGPQADGGSCAHANAQLGPEGTQAPHGVGSGPGAYHPTSSFVA